MFNFIPHVGTDIHAILIHFPIAMLVLSFVCVFVKRRWTSFADMEWNLFWMGTVACWPATVSGVVEHFPYEELPVHEPMSLHQFPAMFGTFALTGLAIYRFRARRKVAGTDTPEPGDTAKWKLLAAVGLCWITIVGGTGGSLTYDYGVNVRGVNPLLKAEESVEATGAQTAGEK